jgi:soluble lytic murein transglycosylase-like protein
MNRAAVSLALGICLCAPVGPTASTERIDSAFVTALREAARDRGMFDSDLDALVWLAEMSERLHYRISDPFYRTRLLKLAHSEALENGLDPQLVLALIEVESEFDRHAVSKSGARGLMQVMPFWISEIGETGDDLFNPVVNIRYGCRILKHYIERADRDIDQALAAYNGSLGQSRYPNKVNTALVENWQFDEPGLPSTAFLLAR